MADDYNSSKQPASPYKQAQSKKPVDKKTGKKTTADGEVTILTSLLCRPEISDEKEIELLYDRKWAPSTADFEAIAGKTRIAPGNLIALLGLLNEFGEKSIKRLNFFTHSNEDSVGIR